MLQVDRQTLLVTVIGFEVERTWRNCPAPAREQPAAGVAALGFFEFDHLGAQVAEHRRRYRPLLPDRPIDYANTVQRRFHIPKYNTIGRRACILRHPCAERPIQSPARSAMLVASRC